MQVELPDVETWAPFEIRFERPMGDDAFFEFCAKNRKMRIEREASGEIIIMPPAGGGSGYRNNALSAQLWMWAESDGRGRAFDSGTGYFLPNGSAYSPDASWVSNERLSRLTPSESERFLYLCPEFVAELTSPSDRLSKVQAKMAQWIASGVTLGWLIDAAQRTTYVYRPGKDPERLIGVDRIGGEGPIGGFQLELAQIWRGPLA